MSLVGEDNPAAKLTRRRVRRLRAERSRLRRTFVEIAQRLAVHPSTACRAFHGVTWGHVR
jgi:hypothetical protein